MRFSQLLLPSFLAILTTFPLTLAKTTNSTTTRTPTSSATIPLSSTTDAASNDSTIDVYLSVPQLSVGRIELDVDSLSADLNLNAAIANLVTINAGVQVSVQKVNITIEDVDAELELIVRLGNLVNIVNRVFASLDLNPLLITALNNVTSVVDTVVGAVDGLLGSITQGGTTLNFIVDNLGNIVQEVAGSDGSTASSIVGNYLTNMTQTGTVQNLANGDVQKTFSYSPLNALVNVVFNGAGQVVSAVVTKAQGVASGSSSTSTVAATSVATSAVPVATSSTVATSVAATSSPASVKAHKAKTTTAADLTKRGVDEC